MAYQSVNHPQTVHLHLTFQSALPWSYLLIQMHLLSVFRILHFHRSQRAPKLPQVSQFPNVTSMCVSTYLLLTNPHTGNTHHSCILYPFFYCCSYCENFIIKIQFFPVKCCLFFLFANLSVIAPAVDTHRSFQIITGNVV